MTEESTRTYTFPKTGERVTIRRVSPRFLGNVRIAARRRFIEENGEPVCPTYEVEIAGGAVETHPHNETTVIEEHWLADNGLQESWAEYKDLSSQLESHMLEQRLRANVYRGVVENPPDEWIAEQEYWGVDLPDDKHELKWDWVWDLSGGSWTDVIQLTTAMTRILDPVEEAAIAAAETFQRALELGRGSDDRSDQEETVEKE
jgi:hypothetical protein